MNALLIECPACNGKQYVETTWPDRPNRTDERTCQMCRGSGVVPTEDGRKVIALYRWVEVFDSHDP